MNNDLEMADGIGKTADMADISDSDLETVAGGSGDGSKYCPRCGRPGLTRDTRMEGDVAVRVWFCNQCGQLPPDATPYDTEVDYMTRRKQQPNLFRPLPL